MAARSRRDDAATSAWGCPWRSRYPSMSMTIDAATVDSRTGKLGAIGQCAGAGGHFGSGGERAFCTHRVHARFHRSSAMNSSKSLLAVIVLIAATILPASAAAQTRPGPSEDGLHITAFRSPSTGLEYRWGRFGLHTGYYPTILKADGPAAGENTNFVRTGGSYYFRSESWTLFVSPALLISLDDDWDNAVLTEVGVRVPVFGRTSFRLGVGVLTTFDGVTRVNPTIGFDVRLGAA